MGFHVENLVILFGLFALAVPILLHLLKRRRFDTLDWGAMQFLPDSSATQRRRWLDEILLMLLRMGMIGLIVMALATPISTGTWSALLGDRSTRDIVIVLDGSYSMDARVGDQPTPWADALKEAKSRLQNASNGDRFAMLIARQPPRFWHDDFAEASEVLAKLDAVPAPRGNPDMPSALAEAWKHLQTRSKAAAKEIVVCTDRQRHGWADLDTLAAFENIGSQWQADAARGDVAPSLRVIQVGGNVAAPSPNFSLAPLTTSRNVVQIGQRLTFQSAVQLSGFDRYARPKKLKVLMDGQYVRDLSLPEKAELKQGQIPLTWSSRFDKEGQRVVSLIMEADLAQDALTADNEQHVVIEVVKELPVLLVDGDRKPVGESSSFFLQQALPAKRVAPFVSLKPGMLTADRPAVIVLADVPRLDAAAIDTIDQFLAEGGGMLIAVGERVAREKAFYNERLYRQGQGWLPARLTEIGSSQDGVQPEPRKFQHPALEVFRAAPEGVMNQVRFAKWWKTQIGLKDRATPVATLSNGDPFLIEMPYKKGRVILCTTPLDRRWGSTLPNVAEFPVLAHELVYYLAGATQAATTLRRGEPIRLSDPGTPMKRVALRTPEIEKDFDVKAWPWTYADTGAIGVYQAREKGGRSWSFVAPPDLRESDLTRCTEADWQKVRERLPIVWQDEPAAAPSIAPPESQRNEVWWMLLLGVLGLLCTEVWMTRRMALARGQ